MNPNFLLLLDTSGSMYGAKIVSLNLVVDNLLEGFKSLALGEVPQMAVITFGGLPEVHPYTPIDQITTGWEAGGETRLSEALELASTLATESTITLIVTDGTPIHGGHEGFAKTPLSSPVYGIGIGYDADLELLGKLTTSPHHIFPPVEAEYLPGHWYNIYAK